MMKEDEGVGEAVFDSKEVLLKIIERPNNKSEEDLALFIESISEATNRQSKIVEADRRSNDPRLIQLQKYFYKEFGLFLERKRGEFQYGLDEKIIKKKDIIDRVVLLRAVTAYDGNPAFARSSEDNIFEEDKFDELLSNIQLEKAIRAYFVLSYVDGYNAMQKARGDDYVSYGKYAVIHSASQIPVNSAMCINEQAKYSLEQVIKVWPSFEKEIVKYAGNSKYMKGDAFNFDGYYKGSTLADDIVSFSWGK